MAWKKKLLIGVGVVVLGAAAYLLLTRPPSYAPLTTVTTVDLNRYTGKWYEIAAFPQRFQKGCHCTTAEYAVNPQGYVEIFNACRKNGPSGKIASIQGKAFAVPGSQNSKLKVQFFWPFTGDYWILALDDDYTYALVGTPDRKSLWVLSRRPVLPANIYQQLLQTAGNKGFNINQLRKTNQRCG